MNTRLVLCALAGSLLLAACTGTTDPGTACLASQACTSAAPCKVARTTCASADAVATCTDTGNAPDGTACGTGNVCTGGTCAPGVALRPTVASFSATPATVGPGGAVVLAWSVTGADAVTIDQGVGAVTGPTVTVTPSTTTTYTLTATNAAGSASLQVTVVVGTLPSVASFTVSTSNIAPGASTTLAWSVANADQITIDQDIGVVAGTTRTVSPTSTTTYTLTASNAAGTATGTATVTVSSIASVYLTDVTVVLGRTVTLTPQVTVSAGNPSLELDWSVAPGSLGSVSPARGVTTTFTAPVTPGRYVIWGQSTWDPTKKDYCNIDVILPPHPTLHSAYFREDADAQRILDGTPFDVSTAGLSWPEWPWKTLSTAFVYRLIVAFKLAGLSAVSPAYHGQNLPVDILNAFQGVHGLPLSPFLDEPAMQALDARVLAAESHDASATSWICYPLVATPPANEPSRAHLASLYETAINAFPTELRLLTEADCLNPQTFASIHDGSICAPLGPYSYWWGVDASTCIPRPVSSINEGLFLVDDRLVTTTSVHEHAHWTDRNAPVHSANAIDTSTFYDISYVFSSGVFQGAFWYFLPRVDSHDDPAARQNWFSYGDGSWYSTAPTGYSVAVEDYATCVDMYVTAGIVFRDYMKDKPVLSQKYAWIRDHVFHGVEFATGDPGYAAYAPDLWKVPGGIVEAGGYWDLGINLEWDHTLPTQ